LHARLQSFAAFAQSINAIEEALDFAGRQGDARFLTQPVGAVFGQV
jgi:hypothetical protein